MNERHAEPASLAARLRDRIRREGPISFRDWMAAALYDEREGYYRRADRARWGPAGDYRTSAERSPLFPAAFAAYFAALFGELGSPPAWTIVEAGAGAGDFAGGVLGALRDWFPHVYSATQYIIDEVSDAARAQAREKLLAHAQRVSYCPLHGIKPRLDPGIIFSNELLDALPAHRVMMRGGQLRELFVGVDADGAFIWVEAELSTPRLGAYFDQTGWSLVEGQMAEVNLEAQDWMARAASALRRGFLITVDYGAEAEELYGAPHRRQGTLRAFHQHRIASDPLARPGEQDLTASVNWTAIKNAGAAAGLETVSFERLDRFLLRAGLLDHLERMAARAPDEAARTALRLGAREMILPGGMAQSFQVLIQKKTQGAGFTAET
jgi:SAM-dependent MidA family methyltransferase